MEASKEIHKEYMNLVENYNELFNFFFNYHQKNSIYLFLETALKKFYPWDLFDDDEYETFMLAKHPRKPKHQDDSIQHKQPVEYRITNMIYRKWQYVLQIAEEHPVRKIEKLRTFVGSYRKRMHEFSLAMKNAQEDILSDMKKLTKKADDHLPSHMLTEILWQDLHWKDIVDYLELLVECVRHCS